MLDFLSEAALLFIILYFRFTTAHQTVVCVVFALSHAIVITFGFMFRHACL